MVSTFSLRWKACMRLVGFRDGTATNACEDQAMQVVPYLFFDGTCNEALLLYARVFDGTIESMMKYGDAPSNGQMPPGMTDRIMRATLQGPGFQLTASDASDLGSGSMARASVSIALPDVEEGRRIFEALAAGGTIQMPYEKQFWGATFGSLLDKFGISWMVNAG